MPIAAAAKPSFFPLHAREANESTVVLGRKCGSGSQGDVYEGPNDSAIKVAQRTVLDGESVRALRHEAQILMKCKQQAVPHIVEIKDYHRGMAGKVDRNWNLVSLRESENKLFSNYDAMSMERLHGGSLQDRINRSGNLPETECKTVTRDILWTLHKLHREAHVIHRDLKPANVMFEGGEVKLIDFGVASESDRPTTPVGTPYYLAPEVWKGDRQHPYNAKADLWSLGVMTYYMVHGRQPFDGRDCFQIQHGIKKHFKHPDRLVFSDKVSLDCKKFILSLLSPVDKRPSAMEALNHPWLNKSSQVCPLPPLLGAGKS